MASLTAKTSRIRRHKLARRGKARKRSLNNKGTTPVFAVHPKGSN